MIWASLYVLFNVYILLLRSNIYLQDVITSVNGNKSNKCLKLIFFIDNLNWNIFISDLTIPYCKLVSIFFILCLLTYSKLFISLFILDSSLYLFKRFSLFGCKNGYAIDIFSSLIKEENTSYVIIGQYNMTNP